MKAQKEERRQKFEKELNDARESRDTAARKAQADKEAALVKNGVWARPLNGGAAVRSALPADPEPPRGKRNRRAGGLKLPPGQEPSQERLDVDRKHAEWVKWNEWWRRTH